MTEIATHIVLSTAHLSKETSDKLTEKGTEGESFSDWRDSTTVCDYDYGHWVMIGNGDIPGTPDDLLACTAHARLYGASWILFDRDCEAIDQLEIYEW